MTLHPRKTRSAEAGYSLIEVLLASALMAGVLVSVSTLFVMGSKSVKAGRELTKAVTIANSAMEQVQSWNYDKVWMLTGGASTGESTTFSTLAANPVYTGSTADVADMNAAVNAWRDQVEAELQGGYLTYRVDGMEAFPSAGDAGRAPYSDCDMLRVTVTVFWLEAKRQRHVTFEGGFVL